MKKLITATVLLLAITALPLSHLLLADPGKVAICHKGYVIMVSHHAVAKHFAKHGDCLAGVVMVPNGPTGFHCECNALPQPCDP